MTPPKKFIILDDDPINNFICKEVIKQAFKEPQVVLDFTSPEKCLEFIDTDFNDDSRAAPIALFVDINMPVMSGWEFLQKFSVLDESIRKKFDIYMISSSINPSDKELAASNPFVKDYITKPISPEFLNTISS